MLIFNQTEYIKSAMPETLETGSNHYTLFLASRPLLTFDSASVRTHFF